MKVNTKSPSHGGLRVETNVHLIVTILCCPDLLTSFVKKVN